MSLAQKIFELLPGTWRIFRNVPGTGYLCGFAIFEINSGNPGELLYSENGIFYFDNGKSLEASKKYTYRLESEDIYVYDLNCILFHKFGINEITYDSNDQNKCFTFNSFHLSGDCEFHIAYDFNFSNNQEFFIIHDVKSTSTDYVSKTRFKKIKEIL
jgi:hypothetical protein